MDIEFRERIVQPTYFLLVVVVLYGFSNSLNIKLNWKNITFCSLWEVREEISLLYNNFSYGRLIFEKFFDFKF